MRPRDLSSTFFADMVSSVNFPELSVQKRDLPSTSIAFHWCTFCQLPVNFLCGHGTFRKLSLQPQDLSSNSVNFLCRHATIRPFSMLPGDLPSTSINLPCCWRPTVIFRQLFVQPRVLPSTSVNFACSCRTFRQLLSPFCASKGLSVNFINFP